MKWLPVRAAHIAKVQQRECIVLNKQSIPFGKELVDVPHRL
jgi:hypothetical protein